MMLEAAGFTVVDLGVSVPPEDFIAAIRKHKPKIVGFSALLTTTMNMQWETLKVIKAEGLREDVRVFVGGAPISQAWCDKIGADAYASDALVAVDKARACVFTHAAIKGGDPELHTLMLAIDICVKRKGQIGCHLKWLQLQPSGFNSDAFNFCFTSGDCKHSTCKVHSRSMCRPGPACRGTCRPTLSSLGLCPVLFGRGRPWLRSDADGYFDFVTAG